MLSTIQSVGSFAALFAAFWIFRRKQNPLWLRVLFMAILVPGVVALAALEIADSFTGRGIDESVVYHLWAGTKGAGYSEYTAQFNVALSALVLCILVVVSLWRKPLAQGRFHSVPSSLLVGALLLISVVTNPGLENILNLLRQETVKAARSSDSTSHGAISEYVIPELADPPRRNIVWLYVESLERTYMDEQLFPGLMPNLRRLRGIATDFTDIRQVYGTGWTIGGLVGSLCGIPLTTPKGFGNSLSGLDGFLPGAVCLGDVLNQAGYQLGYMQGADIRFAGHHAFASQHGFQHVHGLFELEELSRGESYRSPWGLYDDEFLDLVAGKIAERAGNPQGMPYAQLALTLDTHHPDGHVSEPCEGVTYRDGRNPILNAVHCTDRIISNFVDRVLQDRRAGNPLIVIQSDHLAMKNSATGLLDQSGARRNLLMIIDPLDPVSKTVGKSGSLLDVGATVLSMLAPGSKAIGFGRSLLTPEPTVVERQGDYDSYLSKTAKQMQADIWEFPDLSGGMSIDIASGVARLGIRIVQLPALMTLKSSMELDEIYLKADTGIDISDVIIGFDYETRFIWIDHCRDVNLITAEPSKPDDRTRSRYCVGVSRGKGRPTEVNPLPETVYLPPNHFSAILLNSSDKDLSETDMRSNAEAVNRRLRIGDAGDGFVSLGPGPDTRQLLVRSGGWASSRKSAVFSGPDLEEKSVDFGRDLTLFGVSTSRETLVPLQNVDTCNPAPQSGSGSSAPAPLWQRLELRNRYPQHDVFVLMANDSAFCGERELLGQIERFYGLRKLENIGFRTPYLAVMSRDKILFEAAGETNDYLLVEFGSE
ncbi:sulfatase-like hydrolase/transferase [Hoeflea sp.]|uniref:sulfatase-like hydrolase/transferase n=1 Tax=Hoeflea sp. TaxID=1940281 RepID=UPI003B52292F